jgi:hypothetical protein
MAPRARSRDTLVTRWRRAVAFASAAWLAAAGAFAQELPTALPAKDFAVRKARGETLDLPRGDEARLRRDALSRAILWESPAKAAQLSHLGEHPDDFFEHAEALVCQYRESKTTGSTPKFECVFEGGEVLKVKYGGSPEVHTEVAATRLMGALGAVADRMYFVRRLRCFGCPPDGTTGPGAVKAGNRRYVDFTNVAIERRQEGRVIKTDRTTGWGWDELADAQKGQTRAQRDALRLLAVFLNDWDNRPDNQRLVCLEDGSRMADGGCHSPVAYMQDVGATFGYVGGEKSQRKLDVAGWAAVPIWKDAARCVVSIRAPWMHGATFDDATISESGRTFLARRLARLDHGQIRDLFAGAHFDEYRGGSPDSRNIDRWVQAFERKVREITQRPPCPTP